MELILLAAVWLLSPPVLAVLLVRQHKKTKYYKDLYESMLFEEKNKKNIPDADRFFSDKPPIPPAAPQADIPRVPRNMPVGSIPAPPPPPPMRQNVPPMQQNVPPVQNIPPTQQNIPPMQNVPPMRQINQVPPPPPKPVPPKKTAEDQKVSSMNIMLILGAMFIIISGLIFATTSWQFLSSGIRAAVILSFSVVFFAVSALAEKKLRLEKTGLLFYTLGSVFLPITLIASGYFRVFGEWFSLFGDGRPLLLSLTFLSLSAASLRGSAKYSSSAFAYVSMFSLSAAVCSLIFQFTSDISVFSLAAAIYGLIVIFAAEKISGSGKKSPVMSVIRNFAAINTVILSISSFIAAVSGDDGTLTLASCALFSAGYIKSSFAEKNGFGAAVPFALFMTCGMFSAFAPSGLDGAADTLAAASAVTAVLSFMNIIPENVKKAFRYVSEAFAGVTLAVCAYAAFTVPPSWISLFAYIALSAEILSLGLIRRREEGGELMLSVFPAALSVTAAMLSRLVFSGDGDPADYRVFALFILINAVHQTVFVCMKKPKLRTLSSDIVFSLSAVIAEVMLCGRYEYSGAVGTAVYLAAFVLSALTLIIPAAKMKSGAKRNFFAAISAIWTSLGAFVFAKAMTDLAGAEYEDTALFISSAVFLVLLSAVSFAVNHKSKDTGLDTAVSVSVRTAALIYCFGAIDRGSAVSVLLALISAYSVLRFVKTKKRHETIFSAAEAVAGALMFIDDGSVITPVSYALLSVLAFGAAYACLKNDSDKPLKALLPFILTSFSFVTACYAGERILITKANGSGEYAYLIFGGIFLIMTAFFQIITVLGKKLSLRTAYSDFIYSFAAIISVITAMTDYYTDIRSFAVCAALFALSAAVTALPALFSGSGNVRNILTGVSFAWAGLGIIALTDIFCGAGFSDRHNALVFSVSLAAAAAVMTAVSCVIAVRCREKLTADIAAILTRAVSAVYIIFIGTVYSSEEQLAFVSPIFILLAALSAARAKKYSSKPEFISALLLFIVSVGAVTFDAGAEEAYFLLFMSLAAALLYAAAMTLWKNKEYRETAEAVSAYSLGALNFLCLIYLSSVEGTVFYITLTAAMSALAVFAFYKARKTLFTALPLSAAYFAVSYQITERTLTEILQNESPTLRAADITVLVLIAASLAMSRIFHKDSLTETDGGRQYSDMFAFSRFFGVIAYASVCGSEKGAWLVWLILGTCVYSLKRRNQSENTKNLIYTVSAVFPVIAWLTEPFFTPPDILKTELTLLPILIYFTVLRLIWKNKQELTESIHFAVSALCLTVLFFDAMETGELADGLIIVITSFLVLMYSFLVKKKKWFILSVAVIVVSTLFMSRGFWASLAWWVYLLAAGLIFIAVGAANEMKKQAAARNESSAFAEKVTRFMSDWTW